MYKKVTEYIQQKVSIPADQLEQAFSHSTLRYYKKGEYLLRSGEYCNYIGFINSGLIMNTFLGENGKEVVCNFFFEKDFFTYLESIKDNIPSHKNFIALDDCEVLLLKKSDLPGIFALHPGFENLFNQLILEKLQGMILYEQQKRTSTIEERYLYIMENHPELLDRAPLKYIAGYLGVEPPSLSRLRKRLVKGRSASGSSVRKTGN